MGDWIIFNHLPEKYNLFDLSFIKGAGFVLVTSIALYFLLQKNQHLMMEAYLAKTASRVLPVSLEKIWSISPVIVYALEVRNGRSKPIWASNNIETILGYSVKEALSPDWWKQNLHPDDSQQAVETSLSLKSGKGGSHEYRFYKSDGSYLYIKDELALIDESPDAKVFIGVWTDLSKDYEARQTIEKSSKRIEQAMYDTVKVIALLTELRDPYTAGHEARVGELAAVIAEEMGFNKDVQNGLRIAGLVHDVGKVSIPAEILTKPSRLNSTEYALIKTHAETSFLLLKNIDFPWPIAAAAHQHHERINGSGYPHGLKGDEIIIEARILAIADVLESMASHRPYRPALGIETALNELETNAGKLYDTRCVEACLRLFRDKGFQMPSADKLDPAILQASPS